MGLIKLVLSLKKKGGGGIRRGVILKREGVNRANIYDKLNTIQ